MNIEAQFVDTGRCHYYEVPAPVQREGEPDAAAEVNHDAVSAWM